jgi:hypothetical protein
VPRCPSPAACPLPAASCRSQLAASLASPSHFITSRSLTLSLRLAPPRPAPPVQLSNSETGVGFLRQMRHGILRRDSRPPRRVASRRVAPRSPAGSPNGSPTRPPQSESRLLLPRFPSLPLAASPLPHPLTFLLSPRFSPSPIHIRSPLTLTPHRRSMPHHHASDSRRCRIKHLCISSWTDCQSVVEFAPI